MIDRKSSPANYRAIVSGALIATTIFRCSAGATDITSPAQVTAALQALQEKKLSSKKAIDLQIESLEEEIETLSSAGPDVGDLDDQIAAAKKKTSDFEAKALAILAEMKKGLFCSGCGQTRSQILAKGEQFPHPGQHIVAASKEQLRQKTNELNGQLDQLNGEQRRLEALREKKVQEFNEKLKALRSRLASLRQKTDELGSDLEGVKRRVLAAQEIIRDLQQREAILRQNAAILFQQRDAMISNEKRRIQGDDLRRQMESKRLEASTLRFEIARLESDRRDNQRKIAQVSDTIELNRAAVQDRELIQKTKILEQKSQADETEAQEIAKRLSELSKTEAVANKTTFVLTNLEATQRLRAELEVPSNGVRTNWGSASLAATTTQTSSPATQRFEDAESSLVNAATATIEEARKEITPLIKKGLIIARDEIRTDLIGLFPKDLMETSNNPPTPETTLYCLTQKFFTDTTDAVIEDVRDRSLIVRRVSDAVIDRATEMSVQKIRDQVISIYNDRLLGIKDNSASSSAFERAEDAFNKAVSPANLLLKTGGSSIAGYRKYLSEVNEKFWKFIDLAPDELLKP